MDNIKFKKGDFITQMAYPKTFAIYGGQEFEPIKKGDEIDYSLICYYNPSHYTQNDDGTWGDKEKILEFDLDGESTCEYTLQASDMAFWRLCTEDEKNNALRILADEQKLAWDDIKCSLRKLAPGERIMLDEDDYFKHNSSSKYGHNSYYNRGNQNTPSTQTVKRKTITLSVNHDWAQREPIGPITIEHKELVLAECDRLKYSFSTYRGTVVYPQNGGYTPYRQGAYEDDYYYENYRYSCYD